MVRFDSNNSALTNDHNVSSETSSSLHFFKCQFNLLQTRCSLSHYYFFQVSTLKTASTGSPVWYRVPPLSRPPRRTPDQLLLPALSEIRLVMAPAKPPRLQRPRQHIIIRQSRAHPWTLVTVNREVTLPASKDIPPADRLCRPARVVLLQSNDPRRCPQLLLVLCFRPPRTRMLKWWPRLPSSSFCYRNKIDIKTQRRTSLETRQSFQLKTMIKIIPSVLCHGANWRFLILYGRKSKVLHKFKKTLEESLKQDEKTTIR